MHPQGFMSRKHRINPIFKKSLPKGGRLNVRCLVCASDFLFLTSAQIIKELVE